MLSFATAQRHEIAYEDLSLPSLLPYIHAPYLQVDNINEYRLGDKGIPDIILSPLL